MIIHEMKQNTPEWDMIRSGKITGTTINVLFVTRGVDATGFGQGARTLAKKLALERINKKPMAETTGTTLTMRRGKELEPFARARYEVEKFVKVRQVGFIESACGTYGFSPDGLVDYDNGLVEIKGLSDASIHFDLLTGVEPDPDYIFQMKFGMFTAKRDYCDFVSFYPEHIKDFLTRRYYNDKELNKLFEIKLKQYNIYIEQLIEQVLKAA